MAMTIRNAIPADAPAMSLLLQRLVAAGKRTSPADEDFVLKHYISAATGVFCSLFEDDAGVLVGFQSLIRATPNNPYGTPTGWGIIGTHVSPDAARTGVGSRLFQKSRLAANQVGLQKIEALISPKNAAALAYYNRMGFTTYRRTEEAIAKCFTLNR